MKNIEFFVLKIFLIGWNAESLKCHHFNKQKKRVRNSTSLNKGDLFSEFFSPQRGAKNYPKPFPTKEDAHDSFWHLFWELWAKMKKKSEIKPPLDIGWNRPFMSDLLTYHCHPDWHSHSIPKQHVLSTTTKNSRLFWKSSLICDMSCTSKLYIQSTLNIDLVLWHTQLIVCAVKC